MLPASNSSGPKSITVIRASPAQNAILKQAFAVSNSASQDVLEELSQQTGLPQKWIHQWFGRQRVKERKSMAKVVFSSDLDVRNPKELEGQTGQVLSSNEILGIKLETRDNMLGLSSSGVAPCDSDNLPKSASLSDVLYHPPAKRKKNSRAKKSFKQAAPGASRNGEGAVSSHMKPEFVKTDTELRYTPPLGGETSSLLGPQLRNENDDPSNQRTLGSITSSSLYNHLFLPPFAPPKRSPMSPITVNNTSQPQKPRKMLMADSKNVSTVITINGDDMHTPEVTHQSQNPPPCLLRPVFHTQFYNNGPADYSSTFHFTQPLVPTPTLFSPTGDENLDFPYSVPDVAQSSVLSSQHVDQSFDGNNSLPRPSTSEYGSPQSYFHRPPEQASVPFLKVPSALEHLFQSQNIPYTEDFEYPVIHEAVEFSSLPGYNPIQQNDHVSELDDETSFTPTVLDPSVAPLKHLTDILEDFKDENGMYTKLLAEQARETLVIRLVDQQLLETNPFKAAMGLSLLSNLGLKWY